MKYLLPVIIILLAGCQTAAVKTESTQDLGEARPISTRLVFNIKNLKIYGIQNHRANMISVTDYRLVWGELSASRSTLFENVSVSNFPNNNLYYQLMTREEQFKQSMNDIFRQRDFVISSNGSESITIEAKVSHLYFNLMLKSTNNHVYVGDYKMDSIIQWSVFKGNQLYFQTLPQKLRADYQDSSISNVLIRHLGYSWDMLLKDEKTRLQIVQSLSKDLP